VILTSGLDVDETFSAFIGYFSTAYKLTPQGVENQIGWWVAPEFTISYALGARFLVGCDFYQNNFTPNTGLACPL